MRNVTRSCKFYSKREWVMTSGPSPECDFFNTSFLAVVNSSDTSNGYINECFIKCYGFYRNGSFSCTCLRFLSFIYQILKDSTVLFFHPMKGNVSH